MLPKQLSLPPKLLKEIGVPEPSASRSNWRWKSQEQNRKDRRKADRESRKRRQYSTTPKRKDTPGHHHRGTVEDDDESEDDYNEKAVFDTSGGELFSGDSARFPQRKRKRDSEDEEELNELDEPPSAKQLSRSVRDKLAKDDAEIELLERKLGLKKGRKSLPKSFKDDGLDDLLGDFNGGSGSDEDTRKAENVAKEWLALKRRKATSGLKYEAEDVEVEEDDEDDDVDFDEEIFGYEDEEDDNGNHDEGTVASSEEHDPDTSYDQGSYGGFGPDEGNTVPAPKRIKENPYKAPVEVGTGLPKYIPPSMRARRGGDADLEAQIRRKLQGPINRVTEANLTSVVGEIEKIYRDHPRGHTNNILTSLLMAQISDPTSKPDTLLVLSAGFIAALYKIIGVDFAANFLTTSVERFQEERAKAIAAVKEQRIPTKETSNLLTVLAEMYIFRVISSNLMFDLVRILLNDLSELNAELLLRIVRVAGPQLRRDDPLALKDIVSLIRPAVAKVGEVNLTVRTKFMIETISDLKNNKLKAGAQDLAILNEHVTRMRKVLGSLDSQKLKATEPLRIGLKDIEDADKTGKWWLVGASWAGSKAQVTKQEDLAVGVTTAASPNTKDDDDTVKIADADDLVAPDYAQLAREQGMNTDVRRAIFIALVAAADYQDAYMRILKLRLNKYNRREVPNVLVQCSGAQQHYNPYYTLVAKKFCSDSRIKHSFQDTLWTLFRRLGEPLFGEEPEEEEEEAADNRRLINTAKMIGSLVADGAVGLGILKPLNLAYVKETTSLFVEVMLITVLQECNRAKNKNLEQALCVPFCSELSPELARSVSYFLRKKVRDTDLVVGKKDMKKVKQACKVAETLLQKPAMDELA
ncbi:Suppressor of glycerol defect protein 1 [Colletotrichum chlorophyti]|uniref:Suppressor of glycerol defect protein 1 n=1 Tax=Colletotrichum chlorophyti TaxID=708187 RepID=A0A1Q8S119_9PEZI|nr:Suppressor of glycerol defect protein 1 [Colletotrichum chlorophyti]